MKASPFQSKAAHDPEENPQLNWGTFSFSPTFPWDCSLPLKATKAFGVRSDAETPCGGKNNIIRISSNSLNFISLRHRTGSENLGTQWNLSEVASHVSSSLQISFSVWHLLACVFAWQSLPQRFCLLFCLVLLPQGISAGSGLLCAAAIGGMAVEMLHFWKIVSCIFSLPDLGRENYQPHLWTVGLFGFLPHP